MTARTRDDIRAALFDALGAIAPEADPSSLRPDRPMREQLDLDSFDFLNVIVRLHDSLGIDIPEADYGQFGTLEGARGYLAKRWNIA